MTAVRDWWEDPDCPPLPDPPKPPRTSDLTCHNFWTGRWNRRVMFLSPGQVPKHAALALKVELTAVGQRVDDVWLSFYRTAEGNPGQIIGSPYDYYTTSLPAGATMSIDGIRDSITIRKPGVAAVDASHLVYRSTKGHVFRWPEIDCGGVWQMWVRTPSNIPASALIATANAAVKYA
jgi:hypothetical protein